ncbi:MAG: hypothetical protein RI885_727 [Actinomycetota bacterium]
MLVEIGNIPRPYGWGSRTAIAELLGRAASGHPEAELWLGAHAGSPARIIRPSEVGGHETLDAWIAADPAATLGRYASGERLPFLLKVLAAAAPLSLQAHPTPDQALAGFAREDAQGVPLDAPHRNYKDASAKPELIYALSDRFEALCGFRTLESFREIVLVLRDAGGGVGGGGAGGRGLAAAESRGGAGASADGGARAAFDGLLAQADVLAVSAGGAPDGLEAAVPGGPARGVAEDSGAGATAGRAGGLDGAGADRGPAAGVDADARRRTETALRDLVEWLSMGGPDVDRIVAATVAAARTILAGRDSAGRDSAGRDTAGRDSAGRDTAGRDTAGRDSADGATVGRDSAGGDLRFGAELATVMALADAYPGDPGILISLMLNRVTLARGEALYLPAGNIHAYLEGLGVELMAASDNVLRGGLTPKHVDVPELLSVLDFAPVDPPYLRPEHPSPGVEVFTPDVPDFRLMRVTGDATIPVTGPGIVLCVAGSFTLGATPIARGQSFYATPDEAALVIAGGGELFVATTGG